MVCYGNWNRVILHTNYPDPMNTSIEINRRGQYKFQKGKFYPEVPSSEVLAERWKQTAGMSFGTWKELHDWIKNSKLSYRIPLSKNLKSFSLKSPKSHTYLYELGCFR